MHPYRVRNSNLTAQIVGNITLPPHPYNEEEDKVIHRGTEKEIE